MNSALTRSACVCSGNLPPSPSAAGSSGLSPAAIASGSPGLILITSVPGSRLAISRYSALAGSTTSHGMPRPVAASSRQRTVCDLPAPVAPQTNTCRFSELAASGERPGRHQVPVEHLAEPDAAGTASLRPVPRASRRSPGRSAKRTPGTSASGGRASAASSSVDP